MPFGAVLKHALESRFPPWDPARGAPDGIVVLGGAISPALSRIYGDTQLNGSAERVTIIPKLARAYPNARIVFSGGDASLFSDQGREADYLYPLLDSFGVPRERVILESRARNTYENAVFTKELVKPKPGERWLLVTSAAHMPRAIGCFRRAGFAVEAYPVDWSTGRSISLMPTNSFAGGLRALDSAVHEWVGLTAYWLRGRTERIFPQPGVLAGRHSPVICWYSWRARSDSRRVALCLRDRGILPMPRGVDPWHTTHVPRKARPNRLAAAYLG